MIAVPARGRRGDRPRLAAVPVLRPQGAQAGARPRRRPQARVIQAETGGGFGGKEEYPSIIALHAALLALQVRQAGADDLRPPRGHRRDDQAPPGDRPPPDRRHARRHARRPGHRGRHGRRRVLHAHAGRPVARHAPRRRPVSLPERPHPRPGRRGTNTPPNGAFRGFGAPQTEFAAEMQLNRIAEALGLSPLELRRRNVYRLGDTTPTGQVLRESVAGEEVLERAAEAAEFERIRERTAQARAERAGSGDVPAAPLHDRRRDRTARGIGLALAWHGAGFTGSGEVKLASVASLELTADGAIRVLTALDRDGPGHQDDLPAARRRRSSACRSRRSRSRRRTPRSCPTQGPTVASRTAMVVGGLRASRPRRRLRAAGRGARPAAVRRGLPR